MDSDRVNHYFRLLYGQVASDRGDVLAALEELQLLHEEALSRLEIAEAIGERLLERNHHANENFQNYYRLFQSSPIADAVIDREGVIREANEALAGLLNVPRHYLPGKPLVLYVAEGDRANFYTKLSGLPDSEEVQIWRIKLLPRRGEPIGTRWCIAPVRDGERAIGEWQIALYEPDRPESGRPAIAAPVLDLPRALDGLQVLVVDDETDARDFIGAVLASRGVRVRVASDAAEALTTIESFRPDVLVCDIRLPGTDGYHLIRQIREREALQGGHIPAAALTAHPDESREKALEAGFEAYLNKLARPEELIGVVASLAEIAR